jgi:hypothetical protein
MQQELVKRAASLKDLSPWPDVNYMVDESWARIHPYGSEVNSGDSVELQLRILNHAPSRTTYQVQWNVPSGWRLIDAQKSISIESLGEGVARARMRPQGPGLHIVTTDIGFNGRNLKQWTEALVRVR